MRGSLRARSQVALRPALPGLPGLESVEPAGRPAPGGEELRGDHLLDRPRDRPARGLRLRALAGLAHRDPVRRRPPQHAARAFSFEYAGESDHVRYPIPKRVHIEGGSDHHALLVDRDACRLYELGGLERRGGRWHAWSGATWSLRSNRLRPAGWTSADAAGLPIFPGLARYDEARRGVIDHALRFTVARTRRAYVYPARHYASSLTDPGLPPMGLRLRLKASFDIGPFPRQARIVLIALKRYGMIVADNGSNWYISGAPSPGWSNDQLHTLGRVKGSSFEVVDTTSLHP